jgi:hypothetical protein
MESFLSVARPIALTSGPLVIASVAVGFTAVGSTEAMAGLPGIIASVLALAGVFALMVGVMALYAARSGAFGGLTSVVVGFVMSYSVLGLGGL